ncbi:MULTISPECIES: AtzE family amidohydrolase [unclassified Sphingobium]|uniref:AtzE family amidohydrolase n=1 Tax=unclassified Sphingobium TaxID=2611147 RepID=UPI00222469D3|nr:MULTISPECIES: AtzE family amidohydrolase [unclassified Sphingobium]MCW2395486.1 AtzE family amidohydrolase [Sphingobium sp. B8D3B]MCW2419001.1 AtzE family amidohydrolase [Sphingobium sp. B8D3C]
MTDFAAMGAAQIAAGVNAGAFSASDVVRDMLARIERLDPLINSCTAVFSESAVAAAAALDAAIARGEPGGPMAGVPVVVKNLFDIAGEVTLAGAKMRREAPPASEDATAVRLLREAGAIIVASTNMDEFAYGFTTENDFFGPTRNPHDLGRLAGGSSGGAAAAVAAGLAHIGMGSDTNGSIRVPASFCGLFGLKPTYGRLSRAGTFPFVSSLDHIGPMTRSVADLALAYDVLQGPDPRDPVCSTAAPEPVLDRLGEDTDAFRVGVLGGWFRGNAEDVALEAVDKVADALNADRYVELDEAEIARYAAFVITAAEGGNLHIDALRQRPDQFDPATRDRLFAGALLPSTLVVQAQRFRYRFREAARRAFAHYDVLLAPATPCAALKLGQQTLNLGGKEMLARAHVGIYTQPISYIGLPVLTAPVMTSGPMPVGVQIIAAPWAEAKIFQIAARLEAAGVAVSSVAHCAPVSENA